jgi:hypothetical protein
LYGDGEEVGEGEGEGEEDFKDIEEEVFDASQSSRKKSDEVDDGEGEGASKISRRRCLMRLSRRGRKVT